MPEHRILILDDEPEIGEYVATVAKLSDFDAHYFSDPEEFLAAATASPACVAIDLQMPALDGVGVNTQVRTINPRARVIILTTFDGDEDIYRGMRAGARAYLLKDAPRDELLDCIRAVHAGETFVPPLVAAKLAAQVSSERLTSREREILQLMGGGASNKAIARQLGISEGTVKTHVKSVLQKLEVASRTEAVSLAARRGLIQL